ncbi:hypothetical protein HWI79_1115 [Cryptosporidium felis]|nr:hypothetical protein HWI79_1115 [Cryptosporidium felis]
MAKNLQNRIKYSLLIFEGKCFTWNKNECSFKNHQNNRVNPKRIIHNTEVIENRYSKSIVSNKQCKYYYPNICLNSSKCKDRCWSDPTFRIQSNHILVVNAIILHNTERNSGTP